LKSPTKIIIISALLLLIQGCGFQFWYNRIAWLSTWYADDYISLTSAQEERIETLVEKHAYWHRTTQLPRYNQFIDDVIDDLKNKRIEQNYDSYGDRLISFYHTILDRTLNDAINQLAQLSDEQVDELMNNLNNSAEEQSEQYLEKTDQERLEAATENAIEEYEEWLDDLTDEQEGMITKHIQSIKPTGKLRLEYLKKWREAFSLALSERQSESGKKALHSLLRDPRQLRSAALVANSEHNDRLRKAMQLKLFNSASDDQIEHFIDFLKDYREDFDDLVADAD
jgi:hypothetical protein